MPFGKREPEPQQQQQRDYSNDPPPLRLGGLFQSKSGKALSGRVNLHYKPQDSDMTVGEELVKILTDAANSDGMVRFLVFENKFGNVPYALLVSRPIASDNGDTGQAQPGWNPPENPQNPPAWVTQGNEQMTTAPVPPRPPRRVPPRRG